MQQKIREIAARVRELRELSGISEAQMAEKLQLSTTAYQRYESGDGDIPASFLLKIAAELQIDTSLLLTGDMPRLHIFCVTRRDKGMAVERRADYVYRSLAANFVHKKAEPFWSRSPPDPATTPPAQTPMPGRNSTLSWKVG